MTRESKAELKKFLNSKVWEEAYNEIMGDAPYVTRDELQQGHYSGELSSGRYLHMCGAIDFVNELYKKASVSTHKKAIVRPKTLNYNA